MRVAFESSNMSDDEPTEVEMQDGDAVEEEHMMYGHGNMTEEELNSKVR